MTIKELYLLDETNCDMNDFEMSMLEIIFDLVKTQKPFLEEGLATFAVKIKFMNEFYKKHQKLAEFAEVEGSE